MASLIQVLKREKRKEIFKPICWKKRGLANFTKKRRGGGRLPKKNGEGRCRFVRGGSAVYLYSGTK